MRKETKLFPDCCEGCESWPAASVGMCRHAGYVKCWCPEGYLRIREETIVSGKELLFPDRASYIRAVIASASM